MGVLLEKIKTGAMQKYEKAGDKLAKLSKLTPGQIEDLQEKREKYLSQMPSMDDEAAIELTSRLIAASSVEVFNSYLGQIKDVYMPEEISAYDDEILQKRICYFDITKWVSDKKENSLEKLVNVYQVLEDEDCNIALVFRRTVEKCFVYLGVLNNSDKSDPSIAKRFIVRLEEAIKGNFPGSQSGDVKRGVLEFLSEDKNFSVATISNVPSEKSEKFISQTIEKLLDGIVPDAEEQEYTVVLLATPIHDVENRKTRLGEIYTGLAPYASWQTNYTFNESDATNALANFGVNVGVSAGVQAGRNQGTNSSVGTTDSSGTTNTDSTSDTNTQSTSDTVTDSTNTTDTKGSSDNVGVYGGAGIGIAHAGASYNHGWNRSTAKSIGKSIGKTVGESTAKTIGKAVANSVGHAVTNTVGKYAGTSQGVNAGANVGANFARSSSITATVGCNEAITQTFTNYNIKHLLENLEKQMERMDISSALGMWDFAAYVVSEDNDITNNVAHMYEALTQGEESFMSHAAINTWRGDISTNIDQNFATQDDLEKAKVSVQAKEIFKYIRSFQHPVFSLSEGLIEKDSTFLVYPLRVTPTTALSGKELAYSLNFPAKSISGFPVLECAAFGRSVSTYDLPEKQGSLLNLGQIFHMNHKEKLPVKLDANSLTSHVFITGSTGSGKSNTVYQLLNEAKDNKITFLVIEPAKGEYKHIFGNMPDVEVYGTNPTETQLLQINPFSFPREIHILEHLDRLVEIFNVCWPMYAAMPAVLKEAIEKSYEDAGWNLTESINSNGEVYPTFKDVAQNIKIIIDTSEYDTDNKGAYKGSLLTRLKTLTNGLNGQIFTTIEMDDSILFDKNVIIDLSRVGSQETKSLLMGVLVLKLQEYRMTQGRMNADLNHITVLEEAHNLLKRTSTEQSAESANLAGKSVEMLTNAIAEMRTYGEGFIIADQAPALLDMAVIRNTNTKIIMRLPDLGDRELAGRAANLNDDQITELAKLPRGVAAVYQNEWVEAVLCKITHYKTSAEKYKYKPSSVTQNNDELYKNRIHVASLLSRGEKLSTVDSRKELDSVNISFLAKSIAIEYLQNPPSEPRMTKLAPVMAALFPKAYEATKNTYVMNPDNPAMWSKDIVNALNREHYWIDKQNMDQVQRDIVQALITQYVFNEIHQGAKLEAWSEWTKHNGF